MSNFLPYVYGFCAGAALVGAWWWWIGNKAKARDAVKTAEQAAQQIGKKF